MAEHEQALIIERHSGGLDVGTKPYLQAYKYYKNILQMIYLPANNITIFPLIYEANYAPLKWPTNAYNYRVKLESLQIPHHLTCKESQK